MDIKELFVKSIVCDETIVKDGASRNKSVSSITKHCFNFALLCYICIIYIPQQLDLLLTINKLIHSSIKMLHK